MSDWAVMRGREILAIYNGQTDEKNKSMAERAAASGTYGQGCTVAPYTPPPAETPAVSGGAAAHAKSGEKR
jgi:hypothetical protein